MYNSYLHNISARGSEAGWHMPSRRFLIIKYSNGVGTATTLGYIQAFIGIVSLSIPTIGGWMWDNFSPTTVFQVGAVVNVFGCIPLLVLLMKTKRKKFSTIFKRALVSGSKPPSIDWVHIANYLNESWAT